ncbi:MAG: IS200/IS605 family transposase [Bacteroidota bacterium]
MPNTYTQIHIQAIFAVKNRQSLVRENWQGELYQYITGILQAYDHKLLQINGMSDHVHVFFGMRPNQSLSRLMQLVKGESSEWINKKKLTRGKFSWQAGYGAFSYSKSQVPQVIRYIQQQKEHHQKKSFLEEYVDLLEAFGVDFDKRYLFSPIS